MEMRGRRRPDSDGSIVSGDEHLLPKLSESKNNAGGDASKGRQPSWVRTLFGVAVALALLAWRSWLLQGTSKDSHVAIRLMFPSSSIAAVAAGDSSQLDFGVADIQGKEAEENNAQNDGDDGDGDGDDDEEEGDDGEEEGDDGEEGEEEDIEPVLPIGRKVSVLLTKEMVQQIEERQKSKQIYNSRAAQYLKNSETYTYLSAAAGHPQLSKDTKKAPPKPVKDFQIERHFTRGHWYVPGEKYFVYQPSGGMSNQRLILAHAVLIAKTLGRTLVVPPVAPHTSMFWNYNKVDWERTVDAFQIFQKERMQAAVPVLGLSNCILRRFVEFNENKRGVKWLRVQRNKEEKSMRGRLWTTQDMHDMFSGVTEDVLFFAQTSMWRSFKFTAEELKWAHDHVQLDSEFRRVARTAVEHLYPVGAPYTALHIRFEDKFTQVLSDILSPAHVFTSRLARHNASAAQVRQIYVATQPNKIKSVYFEGFRKSGFELTFSDKLMNSSVVLEFLDRFPKNDIQSSVLGLIEQLICARATNFLGTGYSTFSQFIRFKRNNKVLVYDETLLPKTYRYDEIFLSQCTPTQVKKAFKKVATTKASSVGIMQQRLSNEKRLVNTPGTCDPKAVSTRVC